MIGYITRDKDGALYLHSDVPYYEEGYEGWFSEGEITAIHDDLFSDLKYNDNPIKVKINFEIL